MPQVSWAFKFIHHKRICLSGNQESVFTANSIDDHSSGFTPTCWKRLKLSVYYFGIILWSLHYYPMNTRLNCHKSHLHIVTFQPFPPFIPRLKENWKWQKLSMIYWIHNLCLKDRSTYFFLNHHTTAHNSTQIPSWFLPQRQNKVPENSAVTRPYLPGPLLQHKLSC